MSRKVSLRLPDSLWEWLSAKAGNRPISATIADCLSKAKSGSGGGPENRYRIMGIVILTVGLAATLCIAFLRRERQKRKQLLRNQ